MIDHVNSRGKIEGLVFGWGFDLVSNENITAEAIEQAEGLGSIMLMNIMRKLNDSSYKVNPSIWVVLSGSQSVAGSLEMVNLNQEGLRGIARVIVNEFPNYSTTLLT